MNISKIVSIGFLVLGLVYTVVSLQLPVASIGSPYAPKVFPLLIGLFTIGVALALVVQESRKQAAAGSATTTMEGFDLETLKPIGMVTGLCILYALIFDHLGYVLATILFIEGVMMVFNGVKKWKQNTLVAVIFSVFIYILFAKILSVYLPPLPFWE